MSNEQEKKPLIKLSASSTKTYESCNYKYYLTYIDKQYPKKEWKHLVLGKFVHSCLEQLHRQWNADKNLNIIELMSKAFADQRQNKEYVSLPAQQLEEAKVMLQDYLFMLEKNGMPNVLAIEEGFNLIVDKYVLRGFIDRIDVDKDGLFHIVDYKTTKNEKYLDDFQILIYGLALKNKYPDMERFRGSYILLKKGSKYMTDEYNLEDIEKCEKKIIEYGNSIENEKIWRKNPSPLCNYCDFYEPCQGVSWL